MKHTIKIAAVVLLAITSLFGCSDSDVSGTYRNANGSDTITLTKDGKFVASGGAGEYTVENGEVIISIPMVGGTKAKIDGNKLIVSDKKSAVGKHISGTWIKTE